MSREATKKACVVLRDWRQRSFLLARREALEEEMRKINTVLRSQHQTWLGLVYKAEQWAPSVIPPGLFKVSTLASYHVETNSILT